MSRNKIENHKNILKLISIDKQDEQLKFRIK